VDCTPLLLSVQPANRPILVRLDGVLAGEVTVLERFPLSLGRDPSSDVVLDDKGVSRTHAIIRRTNSGFEVEDQRSKNGTYLSGARVGRCPIKDGNVLQFGNNAQFRFALVEERQEELLRQLFNASTRDALTGAYNRRYFESRLTSELAFARRHSTELSLLVIDIDRFKAINDGYGHPTGDVVLRRVSTQLQQQMRTEDVFSRIGGEEFAVLLRGTNLDRAALFAERLRTAVESNHVNLDQISIRVTISAGCAARSEVDLSDGRSLISLADARLYAAKQAGRNRVVSS
jgi:diguanylate cyclase (GGDEF)-like protein